MQAMDFRDNWLKHFRAVIDKETAAAGGNVVAGREAVARKIEKKYDTVYQHHEQKSGKVYPTVEMMVMLEKHYGQGRPMGWTSLDPESEPAASKPAPIALALGPAIEVLRQQLDSLTDQQCKVVEEKLLTLVRAPDSTRNSDALIQLMVSLGERTDDGASARQTGTNG